MVKSSNHPQHKWREFTNQRACDRLKTNRVNNKAQLHVACRRPISAPVRIQTRREEWNMILPANGIQCIAASITLRGFQDKKGNKSQREMFYNNKKRQPGRHNTPIYTHQTWEHQSI